MTLTPTNPYVLEIELLKADDADSTYLWGLIKRLADLIGHEALELIFDRDDQYTAEAIGFLITRPDSVSLIDDFLLSLRSEFERATGTECRVRVTAYEPGPDEAELPEGSDVRFYKKRENGFMIAHTSSSVAVTHVPTGLVVRSNQLRSQHQNYRRAVTMLVGKLINFRTWEVS